MPKDKTETYKKICTCMEREFLKYGYEKASLNRIAKDVGITPAGIYRHFNSKEAMFEALVQSTVLGFWKFCNDSVEEISNNTINESFMNDFTLYREEWTFRMIDYIYDHFDIFKLLLTCASGTKYEQFERDLIQLEVEAHKEHTRQLKEGNIPFNEVSDIQLEAMSSIYVKQFTEVVKQEYTKEEAYEYAKFISKFLYPGYKAVFGF